MTTETLEPDAETVEIPPSDEALTPIAAPLSAWQRKAQAWGITDEQLAAAAGELEGEPYKLHAEFERMTDGEGTTRYYEPTSCAGTLRTQEKLSTLWIVRCDGCGYEVGVEMRKADPARLLEDRLEKANLPAMFAGVDFDKTDPQQAPTLQACREWIRNFRRDPVPAVGLWGQAGRGKSHLLTLMVETVIRQYGARALFLSAVGAFDELQHGDAWESYWRRLLEIPVLAIDDLGAEPATDSWRSRLTALVDARYQHARPLLIATNVPPHVWDESFGERAASRMRGILLPFRLEGPDRRAQGVQQTLA